MIFTIHYLQSAVWAASTFLFFFFRVLTLLSLCLFGSVLPAASLAVIIALVLAARQIAFACLLFAKGRALARVLAYKQQGGQAFEKRERGKKKGGGGGSRL